MTIPFVIVIAMFAGATIYTQHRARTIDSSAEVIAYDVAPGIGLLAVARGTLRQLEVQLDHRCRFGATPNAPPWHSIDRLRHTLDDAVDRYLLLRSLPGEQQFWAETRRALVDLDSSISTLRDNRGEPPADFGSAIHAASNRLDASLERLIDINAANSRALAERIESTRASEARVATTLDCVAGLAALAASAALFAFVDRSQRLVSEAGELAESRANELDAFAGRVAHDVKAPLSGALLWAELAVQQASGNAPLAAALARLESSLRRGAQLVDALLEFARAGARPPRDAFVSVASALSVLRQELHGPAAAVGITLEIDSPDASVTVACPPAVMDSILSNLARNAIKYMGDRAERTIHVAARAADRRVEFSVRDTGPGMTSDVAATCFEPFRRGPTASQPGVGLGLATVRRLVVAHGGSVEVESTLGEGTVFSVSMPRGPDAS